MLDETRGHFILVFHNSYYALHSIDEPLLWLGITPHLERTKTIREPWLSV